ncbi:primosomal protein DnaI [Caldalkalibacillus salinus]|uniref:primosomal protein DnaI n=1 Tax=Caldalkalibacillus salinus TaxID=2803787 RepID=UPI0019231E4F|nr:primosomal protein DnaI [Caldalkalibacillus salinus]
MEALSKSLEQWMSNKNLHQQMNATLERYLNDPFFQQWWQQFPDWTKDDLTPFLTSIKEYVKEQQHCQGCGGLGQCQNLIRGHCAELTNYGQQIGNVYQPCHYYMKSQEENKRENLIQSHHVPKDIMEGSLRLFDHQDQGRLDAFNAVMDFCLNTKPRESAIGLYLYGPLGVGKSFLLGAACNKLAERGIASYMVYTPDFFREMKGAIAEHKVDEKLQLLKEIPVLIFDDIGAETMSAWARDEVLGSILQYRVMERLPTLYTSNYNYEQLEEHLAYSQKGGIEQLKAKRIMERIRHYTDAYFVNGVNRRSRS